MKKIKFYLIALAGGLFLTFNSCDSDDLTISQDEEIISLQLEETSNKSNSATKAQGHGIWTFEHHKYQFTFHANTMPDGSVKGNGVLLRTDGVYNIKFAIDCMIIDGNTAKMSGHITKDEPEYVGSKIWFRVVDNGEGNNSEPDRLSPFCYWPSSTENVDCTIIDYKRTWEIDSGNIQVK